MGGFADVVGKSLTNLAGAVIDAPASIINAGAAGGSSTILSSGGFLSGLFNRGTGGALAANTFAGAGLPNVPADLQVQYGSGETFFSRNKGLILALGVLTILAIVVTKIFGKKKRVGARRRRRTTTSTTRTRSFKARSVGRKKSTSTKFKKVKQSTYNGYTRKQKNLYNLAKARDVRRKSKK
jgi:hypothetical protein